jgi:hypothetical protein
MENHGDSHESAIDNNDSSKDGKGLSTEKDGSEAFDSDQNNKVCSIISLNISKLVFMIWLL